MSTAVKAAILSVIVFGGIVGAIIFLQVSGSKPTRVGGGGFEADPNQGVEEMGSPETVGVGVVEVGGAPVVSTGVVVSEDVGVLSSSSPPQVGKAHITNTIVIRTIAKRLVNMLPPFLFRYSFIFLLCPGHESLFVLAFIQAISFVTLQ